MTRTELIALLDKLERERFYGSLELRFEAGQVKLLYKSECIKPTSRDNRGEHAGRV